jgi:hypothetical protein
LLSESSLPEAVHIFHWQLAASFSMLLVQLRFAFGFLDAVDGHKPLTLLNSPLTILVQ